MACTLYTLLVFLKFALMMIMVIHLFQVAQNVMTVLKKKNNPYEPVEMERVVMDFTMDCIARTVFSMDLNTPENPDNEFCKYGNNFLQVWRFILGMVAPGLCEWLHIPLFNPKAAKYFENVRHTLNTDGRTSSFPGTIFFVAF